MHKRFLLAVLVLLAFFSLSNLNAQTTTSFPEESLVARLNKIAGGNGVNISFDSNLIKGVLVPALDVKNQNVEKILGSTLSTTGYTYKKMSEKSYAIIKKPVTAPKKPGKIIGKVVDDTGLSLPGATLRVVETNVAVASDTDGNYSLSLEPGNYTIEASFMSFQTQKITGVKVTENVVTPLDIAMKEDAQSLDEVVITMDYRQASTAGLYSQQKKNLAITDGISSEQMKKTADNNIAQVLGRVSGITMQNNKFVVVRGMSERYNNVQLNGSSLPSTEPNRRNFSFDIIPSNLVDNVVVAKTFMPDMPGEFAGGLVQVKTLSVPDQKFLTFSIGNGFNTQSYGKDFYSNTRYSGDYFLGSDKRDWYKNGLYDRINNAIENQDTNLRNRLNAQIPNHWGLQKFNGDPIQNYSVSAGIPFRLKDGSSIGLVGALTYRHEEEREDYEWKERFGSATSDDGIRSTFITSTAALFNSGWKSDNHRIDWRNLYNRRFTHDNTRQTEQEPLGSGGLDAHEFRIYSSVLENELWQTRLDGEHQFFGKKLKFSWFGDFNQLVRDQPDDRFNSAYLMGTDDQGTPALDWLEGRAGETIPVDAGGIYASRLEEKKWNAGGNLEYAFEVAGNQQKVKAGYWGTFRSVDFKQATMRIYLEDSSQENNLSPIQDLFASGNFLDGTYSFTPISYLPGDQPLANRDSYSGDQDINAGYIMGDFSFFKKLHLSGGARLESSKMEVQTVARFLNPNGDGGWLWKDSLMIYKEDRWLPSVNLTYDLRQSLKFRAAYSKTLARADFRERSANIYYDIIQQAEVMGAASLQDGYSKNYDLRLEWYPSAGEVISISAFQKDLTDPVELLAASTATGDIFIYVNLQKAKVQGLEFNMRKHFGFIAASLKNLYLTGNATLLDGWVKIQPTEVMGTHITAEDRDRLPNGLAPRNYNAGLAWDIEKFGAAVNYNYIGHRVKYAGSTEFLDQYESGRSTLDAQMSFRFRKNKMELKLNATDLLAQKFIDYRNASEQRFAPDGSNYFVALNGKGYDKGEDVVLRKMKRGSTFSFTLSYNF